MLGYANDYFFSSYSFFANDLNFLCACRLFGSLAYSGRTGFFGDIGIVLTDILFVVHFFVLICFYSLKPSFLFLYLIQTLRAQISKKI